MFAYAKPNQKQNNTSTVQKKETENKSEPNLTGIPDKIKSNIEGFSGFSFSDVKVHYNSDKPAQLQALAYTQGNQVYIGPGQEKHLGHELGHVVQQKQGCVKVTAQLQGVNINDNKGLEREADLMGTMIVPEKTNNNKLSKNYNNYYSPIAQRKIINLNESEETPFIADHLNGFVFNALKKQEFVKDEIAFNQNNKFITEKQIDEALKVNIQSDNDNILFVKTEPPKTVNFPLGIASFVLEATEELIPQAMNFEVKKPESGKINIEYLDVEEKNKDIPPKDEKKEPGYVVNIASYYNESGVTGIVNKYFNEAISKDNDTKSKRMAIVMGLNSFSSIIDQQYNSQKNDINLKTASVETPTYDVNFRCFGFLWEPYWVFNKKDLPYRIRHLRGVLKEKQVDTYEFKEKQRQLSEYYPYGVFREEVMKSHHTHLMVERLSNWNNPVYIYSGDGDAISLKVPNVDDMGTSEEGVIDKYDKHFLEKGMDAKIVIGGYNLYNLKEENILKEILKAEPQITHYANDEIIDKKNPLSDLNNYKQKDFLRGKIEQIVHNTQVGNRYDRIIRDAISTVYPKMLYPTEPNMLIKAKDSRDNYDLLRDLSVEQKKQGGLWGMGASEGRIFKENMEKRYGGSADGKGFTDWVPGASVPTDPRGFDRHLIISGYEKYSPKDRGRLHAEGGEDGGIPLVDAAVQQAQSYTSAVRLAELYAQTITSNYNGRKQVEVSAKPAFDKVEEMVKCMMLNRFNETSIEDLALLTTGSEKYDEISFVIRQELLKKWQCYLTKQL